MINWLKYIIRSIRPPDVAYNPLIAVEKQKEEAPFIWCLVGNVIGEHYTGEDKKKVCGTKHFSPNTKVYCFPPKWGDGYENIKVIGRHRKSTRNICLIMPSKLITNWRLQKVYRPYILQVMKKEYGWKSRDEDKKYILEMVQGLSRR